MNGTMNDKCISSEYDITASEDDETQMIVLL